MYRWRCHYRDCRRKKHRRSSTHKKIPPNCRGCGRLMTLDRNRTTKAEARRRNCFCGSVKWQPHAGDYSKRMERRQFLES